MSEERHSVQEKGEQHLICCFLCILKLNFHLSPCYLLNYMCMENLQTSSAPLSVFLPFFLETNISWVFPLLFPQYKEIINITFTAFLVPLFLYKVYISSGGRFSTGMHFHWRKQAPANAYYFLKEKFTHMWIKTLVLSNFLASATVVLGGNDVGVGAPWQSLPCQATGPIVRQSYTSLQTMG